jgi:hypothetical protein
MNLDHCLKEWTEFVEDYAGDLAISSNDVDVNKIAVEWAKFVEDYAGSPTNNFTDIEKIIIVTAFPIPGKVIKNSPERIVELLDNTTKRYSDHTAAILKKRIEDDKKLITEKEIVKLPKSLTETTSNTVKRQRAEILTKVGFQSFLQLSQLLKDRFIRELEAGGLLNFSFDSQTLWDNLYNRAEKNRTKMGLLLDNDYRGNVLRSPYIYRIRKGDTFTIEIKLETLNRPGYLVLLQKVPDHSIECLTRKSSSGDESSKIISENDTTYKFPSDENMVRDADYYGEHQLLALVVSERFFERIKGIEDDIEILDKTYLEELWKEANFGIKILGMSYRVDE